MSRSSDYLNGGFGFTIRHFVIYPPSVSVNDILRASYSVVIDEHQQKQLEGGGGGVTTSSIVPSGVVSSSSGSLIHHQGEQQRSSTSTSSAMKIIGNDNIQEDGTTNPNPNLQSIDTIFVKEVRSDGPAYAAGLRQGDQILTVNDQSINGKTYSQVIAMIQNAPADLVLNVVPKEDDILPLNSPQNLNIKSRLKAIDFNRESLYLPSTPIMSNNTVEQKLRNLQLNLAQGRTQQELAQAGIYFPPSTSSQQNAFSNYIDSVHKALDQSKQPQLPPPPPPPQESKRDPRNIYYQSPYHNDYVPYEYKRQPSFQINFNQPTEQKNYLNNNSLTLTNMIRPPVPTRQSIPVINPSLNNFMNVPPVRLPTPNLVTQDQWAPSNTYSSDVSNSMTIESPDELKSPSTDSLTNDQTSPITSNEKSLLTENDMKTEFVNFRKKQFETGHVENIVRDPQRESKTKKYSEKKKYESEWNRLTAIGDVESVMERASHFEDIDPDKFARLKSKFPSSPPIHENLLSQDNFIYDFNPNPNHFYDNQTQQQYKLLKPSTRQSSFDSSSSLSIPRVGDLNSIEFNFDPRFMIQQMRSNPSQAPSSSHYNPLTTADSSRYPLQNYLNNPSSRSGVNLIRQESYISAVRSTNPSEQPDFVSQFVSAPLISEQEMKQRRPPYLLNSDPQMTNREGGYISSNFNNQSIKTNENSFNIHQQQKIRSSSQHQTQAIKKLKNFFGENTPQLNNQIDHRLSLSPQSSSGNQSKSGSFFDGSTADGSSNPRIPLTTMSDNIEASKEGILYCKTVLKEGRRAADRSWRGAWAVLRRGALFLGKEKKHGLLIPLSCDSFPINLQNADVELASDYIKKPRVFKLTTSNHSEFLFQAPDSQSLNEWLDVINEHCVPSQLEEDNQEIRNKKVKDKPQRKSTSSLPPIGASRQDNNQQDLSSRNVEQRKSITSGNVKFKLSLRSPSLKRSPSLRFRKSQKPSISQPTQSIPSLTGTNSPPNEATLSTPRRSFVKSIVKKGLRTLKSSSSLLTSQMSGQIYDESSGESLSSPTGSCPISNGINFGIELEECESSSISRYIPIVVEILTRLVELRGINYQGIYRHAGGLTAVNWLVNELDKGLERIDFNSEKWYDVKAVASTLKTFFAKLPDSLLSSKMTSLCVEASRIETHSHRLVELKRLVIQLDDYRFETLKYLCAHFRRVASKCDINKIDARNLAIIFGPTLIWDSKASLQSNLVDNPEKIRIIESFILYHEWFFNDNEYDSIPHEINPQMPKLPLLQNALNIDLESFLNNETKPSEIIEHIVRAAKRRWSSPLILDSLTSLNSSNDQQTSKPINISVKRISRREESFRSYSVDLLLNRRTNNNLSLSSSIHLISDRKYSQSLKDFFQQLILRKKLNRKNNFIESIRFSKQECLHQQTQQSSILFNSSLNHHILNSTIDISKTNSLVIQTEQYSSLYALQLL